MTNLTTDQILKLIEIILQKKASQKYGLKLKGDKGDQGDMPLHRWYGNSLQFEESAGKWGKLVDLRGPQGIPGQKGEPATAEEIEEMMLYLKDFILENFEELKKDFPVIETIDKTQNNVLSILSTPDQIRDALSTLKGEARLDIKYIKGWEKFKKDVFGVIASGSRFLSSLFDVKVTSLAVDDSIKWNGSRWVNYPTGGSGGIGGVQSTYTTSDFTKAASTTLSDIPNLTATVVLNATYTFEATLFGTAPTSGGCKFALAGTATASAITVAGLVNDSAGGIVFQSKATALGSDVGGANNALDWTAKIFGTITVSGAGTIVPQFAQNTSNATGSVVSSLSTFNVKRIA